MGCASSARIAALCRRARVVYEWGKGERAGMSRWRRGGEPVRARTFCPPRCACHPRDVSQSWCPRLAPSPPPPPRPQLPSLLLTSQTRPCPYELSVRASSAGTGAAAVARPALWPSCTPHATFRSVCGCRARGRPEPAQRLTREPPGVPSVSGPVSGVRLEISEPSAWHLSSKRESPWARGRPVAHGWVRGLVHGTHAPDLRWPRPGI